MEENATGFFSPTGKSMRSSTVRPSVNKEAQERYRELCAAFAICFSTEDGKKVLDYLRGVTIESPVWQSGLGINEATANMYFREGQNELVRAIISRINEGKAL